MYHCHRRCCCRRRLHPHFPNDDDDAVQRHGRDDANDCDANARDVVDGNGRNEVSVATAVASDDDNGDDVRTLLGSGRGKTAPTLPARRPVRYATGY